MPIPSAGVLRLACFAARMAAESVGSSALGAVPIFSAASHGDEEVRFTAVSTVLRQRGVEFCDRAQQY